MTDVNQLITDHLDIWTAATEKKSSAGRGNGGSVSLHGIKKLRELILELAVRGKLVPQDDTDVPADGLLDQLHLQQAQMFAKGIIKKPKPVAKIAASELPFELPRGWTWCRVSQLGHDWGQKVPESQFTYIDVGSINKELGLVSEPTVLEASKAPSRARKLVRNGTVVYSTVRPYLLNIAVITETFEPEPIASTAFAIVHPFDGVSASYLYRYFRSPTFISYVEGCQTGIAYPAINDKQFFSGLVPLPPTEEQHRIVAKVDELMVLCDALERQAEDSLEAHQTLVETCLATLTNSQSPEELTQNWTRIEAHFDTLFTTEESLAELDKTVLQLGMMGLLVKQDLSMSSTSLLETARKTRADLVAKKEVKAFKAKATNEVLDRPFILPSGWSWLRLGEAAVLVTKGSSPKWQGVSYTDDPSEVMFVTSENVGRFEMLLDNPKYVERKFNTVEPRSILKAGDYLMNIVGASIGRTAIYPGPDGANINQAVCLIRVLPGLFDPRFLIAFFNSEFCRGYMFDKQVDNARANLSMGNISQFLIPVPPIEEQVAIAEKLELLSDLSSNLSRRLQARAVLSKSLADTLTSKIH